MAKRKWKGTLTKDLRNYGDTLAGKPFTFQKGQSVVVWKKKELGEDGSYTGNFEYHYSDDNGRGLVRHNKLCLEEYEEDGSEKVT